MQRSQLEHVIRAAAEITNQYEFVVIGSQAIGELSFFHEHFGYYAQGVGPDTAHLPTGWRDRLTRLQSAATNGRVAYCLDPVDLFVSKACAAREKDGRFNRALLAAGIVTLEQALQRAKELADDAESRRAQAWIKRLALPLG